MKGPVKYKSELHAVMGKYLNYFCIFFLCKIIRCHFPDWNPFLLVIQEIISSQLSFLLSRPPINKEEYVIFARLICASCSGPGWISPPAAPPRPPHISKRIKNTSGKSNHKPQIRRILGWVPWQTKIICSSRWTPGAAFPRNSTLLWAALFYVVSAAASSGSVCQS